MEAGKYRAFQGRLNSRSEPRAKLVAKTPNSQVLARVSLLASHERLREKRLCLAGVQAIKSRFFAPIYRKYLYILSYPVFLYYAESPKVPPRVFGPLGPKTLRGQQYLYILSYSSITCGVLRCLLGFLALWGQKPCGGKYLYILSYSSITWEVLRCLLGFLALLGQKPCGGNNVVFPAQAEYSYFSADFRLKIFFVLFLHYSL